jgi:hypothetical protein
MIHVAVVEPAVALGPACTASTGEANVMSERAGKKQTAAALERIARHDAIRRSGGTPDLDDLRALTDSDAPDVAGLAAVALMLAVNKRRETFEAETPRLVRVARSDGLPPRVADYLPSSLAWTWCLYLLQDAGRTGQDPAPGLLAQTAGLAELGYARAPSSVRARKALAFARCAQDRDREARDLLVTVPLGQLEAALQADVLFVRALAELGLRDLAQARRLTDLARRYNHSMPLLALLEQEIAATEQRMAEGTDDEHHA